MEEKLIFSDKSHKPADEELGSVLGQTYQLWLEIRKMVLEKYPAGKEEWNYPGKKYGWSFRIKDKKRAIIYFLPKVGCFKVAFVFGQKAFNAVMESTVDEQIKSELQAAKVYAEGRGVRIDVKQEQVLGDIEKLVEIKLAH